MLDEFLVRSTFHLILVFARMGAVFMLIPGFAAAYVPPQSRLLLAIMTTLVILPVVQPLLPQEAPVAVGHFFLLIGLEVTIGIFIGLLAQFIIVSLHVAGTAIGYASGLMNAMVFDPITEQQGALVIGLLSNVAIVAVFVVGMHHLLLRAALESYQLFRPGGEFIVGDHVIMLLDIMGRAFYVGMQMASPFLLFSILFQTSLGLMARMSPQMNVFFIGLPIQILLGLMLIWAALPAVIRWFLSFFQDIYTLFLGG